VSAQIDPSHVISGPRTVDSKLALEPARIPTRILDALADAAHERQVVQSMLFTCCTGLIAFIAALLTTILDLSILWRDLWLSICIAFAVLMLAGIFQFCGRIDKSASRKITQR
jgi:hypothetical protein